MFAFAFFPISLLHETNKFDIIFSIVCCTESLRQTEFCDNLNFCLLHWVTATNKICTCYKKIAKKKKIIKCLKKSSIMQQKSHKSPKNCQKEPKSDNKWSTVDTFGNFLASYTNFVGCSDSVRLTFSFCSDSGQQEFFFCLSQWLSATKNTDKFFTSLWHVTKELAKKPTKKTSFQIWFSPALSNCFGVPYIYI